MTDIVGKIHNVHLLTDIFGRFPTFHDSEILRITLDRGERGSFGPSLEASIHLFEMTADVDKNNKFILKNHVVALFIFSQIANLRIDDFNRQNVINELIIIDHPSEGKDGNVRFKITFEGIYGIDASFECSSIAVQSVQPFV